MKEAIWINFWNIWVAENGLAKLSGDDQLGETFDGLGFRSVNNDNGILFLAYFIVVSRIAGLDLETRSKFADVGTTIERLVRLPHRGLFDRIPIGTKESLRKPERHDNYVAIVALSTMYGFSFTNEILSYGGLNAWNFNNVEPGKWDVKAQRQGGDIAYYSICAGKTPEILNFIWLLGGLLANAFVDDSGKSNLAWLRLYAMNKAQISHWWIRLPIVVVSETWKIFKALNFGSLSKMLQPYFGENYPSVKMAAQITKDEWGF